MIRVTFRKKKSPNCFLFLWQAQAIKLIYAYGLTDQISYHGVRRGTKEVNLLNHRPRSSHSHLKFLNATVHNVRMISNSSRRVNLGWMDERIEK